MALIEWKDETFGVGVELIDNQHKMLVHIINKLAESVESNEDISVINTIFNQLQDYTKYHFNTEETYFFRLSDADTHLHVAQHNNFIAELENLSINADELEVQSANLLSFLSNWLCDHIQIEDKKLIRRNL